MGPGSPGSPSLCGAGGMGVPTFSPPPPEEPVGLAWVKREPEHLALSLKRSPVHARGDSLDTGTAIGDEKYLEVTKC